MVAAGLVGTPFSESTRPYAKITDHDGRWGGEGGETYVVEPACSAHMLCVCARKHNRGWGGEGGETDLAYFAIKCLMCCEVHRHTKMYHNFAYVWLCSDNSPNMCDLL